MAPRPHLAAALALAALAASPREARASAALKPLLLKHGTYGESFTFIADLEDGTYVQASLSFTNLGPGSTKGICRGLVVQPAGAPWKAATRVSKDAYSWRGGAEERLAIGPCSGWIDGSGTGVEVALEGGTIRLAFAERAAPRGARESMVAIGGDRYETEVLLSRVPVTATLALPGAPERRASGGGYLDHTRSTVAPKDLAARWVRFRALRGDRPLLLLGREGQDGRYAPLWACEGPARCRDLAAFRVERQGGTGAPAFRVAVSGARDPVDLRSGRLLYRDAPVEDLGILGKLVRPFTGNPVTYVFRGQAQDGAGAPIEGILEVEFASE
ncbi:MAG: hypothetical protein ACJ79L_04605 [Anaeromyxobacteraceae bacterium]